MEENKNLQNDEKEYVVIDNSDNVIGWMERFMSLLKEYGPIKIIGGAMVLAVISVFFYLVFNPTKVFEVYEDWKEAQHTRLIQERIDNTPKIQNLLDRLTYKVGASRTIVLELHNGNTGDGGLPFAKATATYESLNIGACPISGQYQGVNLSLIPFASYLFSKGYWCGNTEDIINIDKALYHKMMSNGTEHFAACVIEGIDKEIALLIVSFDRPVEHDCAEIRENIRHIALELAVFIEVGNRIK